MPRRLGQHFLRDPAVLERIANAVAPEHEPEIIEIGPGRGALTRFLVPRCDRLTVVEIDDRLIAPLRVEFPQANVVHSDVMAYAFPPDAIIAGNLPYYITSPIVERVIQAGFARAVFLVQKEVALRLAAPHGTRDYGYLSAVTQLAARVDVLFDVSPGSFAPPPKVDSAVVRLTPRGQPVDAALRRFLSTCFHLKRKNLRNNLHLLFPAIEDAPEARLRAEQLSPTELAALHERLINHAPVSRIDS